MVIATKHDDSIMIGTYTDKFEYAHCNYSFEFTEDRHIRVTSAHFKCYVNKEIVSKITYGEDWKPEDAIKDFIIHHLDKEVARYGIRIHFTTERP